MVESTISVSTRSEVRVRIRLLDELEEKLAVAHVQSLYLTQTSLNSRRP